MQVRGARIEDAEEAVLVVRRSIEVLCAADHDGDARTLDSWLANKSADNMRVWIETSHVLVAVALDGILGVASMTCDGQITLNYVSPNARFSGVSTALLAALEALATSIGIASIKLESTETAHRFYLERGYCDQGTPRKRLGSARAYPMIKPLVSGGGRA